MLCQLLLSFVCCLLLLPMKFGRLSRYLVVVFTALLAGWFALTYGTMRGTFYGDGLGYYLYLPASFIYHNFNSIAEYPEGSVDFMITRYANNMKEEATRAPNGRILIQYTYGVAFLEMPFFFIAHAYEKCNGLPANGFTLPYDYMMKMAAAFLCTDRPPVLFYRIFTQLL